MLLVFVPKILKNCRVLLKIEQINNISSYVSVCCKDLVYIAENLILCSWYFFSSFHPQTHTWVLINYNFINQLSFFLECSFHVQRRIKSFVMSENPIIRTVPHMPPLSKYYLQTTHRQRENMLGDYNTFEKLLHCSCKAAPLSSLSTNNGHKTKRKQLRLLSL